MKLVKLFLTLVIAMLVITGCEDRNVSALKKAVESANAECPIDFGTGGCLVSIKYNKIENQVTAQTVASDEAFEFLFPDENRDKIKKNVRLMLATEDYKELLEDLVNAKAGLTYIFKSTPSSKTVSISLTYQDLLYAKNHPMPKDIVSRRIIDNIVEMANAGGPITIDDGFDFVKAEIVDDTLTYYYKLDENNCDLNEINGDPDAIQSIKEGLINEIRNDLTVKQLLSMLAASNMNFRLRYFGSITNNYIDITYTADELRQYLK
ncbi:MAG: hypothetical protein ACI30K_01115 [Muribaculaceae bacterium]